MNQTVKDKLIRARVSLIFDQPFFGSLALRLLLVECNDIPTLAVDGKHIYYNAQFIDKLSPVLTKSALAHEVGHCIFEHIGRRGTRDPRKWNQAGDYVINQTIKDAGFEIGEGWLLDPAYKGMSADHIYSLIPPDPPEGQGPSKDPLCDMSNGDSSAEPLTPAEQREWKIATVQAANAAKAAGKLPSSMERFIDALTRPQVDWKTVLRRFVTQRDDADYSWSRPNRRMLSNGIYLPSLYSEKMGEIVVAIDTSGSIDSPTLAAFGAELSGIVADSRPAKIHVVYCDAHINKTVSFGTDDPFKLEAVGGGGTDFKPPFAWVEQENINPACLVYLTDLYGQFGKEPGYPTMWCSISDEVAPWGETLRIEV